MGVWSGVGALLTHMVHVPVDDQNALVLTRVLGACRINGNGDIVVDAKSHGFVALGVVAGRAG